MPSCPSCLSPSSSPHQQRRRRRDSRHSRAHPAGIQPRSCPAARARAPAGAGAAPHAEHTPRPRRQRPRLAAPARRSQPESVNSTGGCGGVPCAGPEQVLTERRLRSRARGPQRTWQRRPRSRRNRAGRRQWRHGPGRGRGARGREGAAAVGPGGAAFLGLRARAVREPPPPRVWPCGVPGTAAAAVELGGVAFPVPPHWGRAVWCSRG